MPGYRAHDRTLLRAELQLPALSVAVCFQRIREPACGGGAAGIRARDETRRASWPCPVLQSRQAAAPGQASPWSLPLCSRS